MLEHDGRSTRDLGLALLVVWTIGAIVAPAAAVAGVQEEPAFTASPIYRWLEAHDSAAYWAAPLLMVVVAILPIPAEIPAAMNGMLFGAAVGVLITWGGAMVGAMISYELARCFGRKLSGRLVSPEAMDKLAGLRDTQAPVLLLLRLTPVVAFTVVNWASGLLLVRRSTFAWTTAVGILPGAIVFTASGSLVASLFERYPGTVMGVAALTSAALWVRVWVRRHRLSPADRGRDDRA